MSAPFRMDEEDQLSENRDAGQTKDGKFIMLPKKSSKLNHTLGQNSHQNRQASVIFGADNSNDDDSDDEGGSGKSSDNNFCINFDEDNKIRNFDETAYQREFSLRQGSNFDSQKRPGYHPYTSRPQWRYGPSSTQFSGSKPANSGSNLRDEENTPSFELKPMTLEMAEEQSRTQPTQSRIQDHYASYGPRAHGTQSGQDPSAETSRAGGTSYRSAYNSGILASSGQKAEGATIGGQHPSAYLQSKFITFPNDIDRPRMRMPTNDYDEMFEAAERESELKRNKNKAVDEPQIKERSDPNITISMSHGDDLDSANESYSKQFKSRIGGTRLQQQDEQLDSEPSYLNNEQSQNIKDFLEQKYEDQKNMSSVPSSATPSATPPTAQSSQFQMSSKYGQKYMKNRQLQAQERRNNKLSNQIKKDDDLDQDSHQRYAIAKQIEERNERKKREDFESPGQPREGLMGRFTASYFGDGRPSTLKSISKELHDHNRLAMHDNDIDDDSDQGKRDEDHDKEGGGLAGIDRKHSEQLRQEDLELERYKRELQEKNDTLYPSKLASSKFGAASNSNQITDVRQNIIMMNMSRVGSTQNVHYVGIEDSKNVYSIQQKQKSPEKSRVSYTGGSQFFRDDSGSNRARESMNNNDMGSYRKIYDQRGATGTSLGYGGSNGYGFSEYRGYGSGNQQESIYNKNFTSGQNSYSQANYHGNQISSNKDEKSYGSGSKASHALPQGYTAQGATYGNLYSVGGRQVDNNCRTCTESTQNPYQQHQSQSAYLNQRVSGSQHSTFGTSQNTSKYFYESPSKYVSLKKFSETLFHLADQPSQKKGSKNQDSQSMLTDQPLQSIYTSSAQKQMKNSKQELTLQSWFERLLNHERAIALTVVDQDLVNMIKAMHKYQLEYGHGLYQSNFPTQVATSPKDSDAYERVANYEILFLKPSGMKGSPSYKAQSYDYYGAIPSQQSQKDKRGVDESAETLITNTKIIRIGNDEAITLSNYLFENTSFLLRIMQTIDPTFMTGELKIEKTDVTTAMSGSSVGGGSYHSKYETEKDTLNQSGGRKQGGRNRQAHQHEANNFFTLNEREVEKAQLSRLAAAGVNSSEFKARTSQYNKVGTKPHPASSSQSGVEIRDVVKDRHPQLSLGQILTHVFEKAINVQYHEFQAKLTNPMKDFFFTGDDSHAYAQDMTLAKFWRNLKPKEKEAFWKKIDEEQEATIAAVKRTSSGVLQDCEEIMEETETETDSNGTSMNFNKYKKFGKKDKFMHDSNSSCSGRESISEEEESDNDHWHKPLSAHKNKKATKLSRKYVDFDKLDNDTDENTSDKFSANKSGTDSDDIENQKHRRYYDQGYQLLQNYEETSFNENLENSSSKKKSILKKPTGSGAREALDKMSDDDSDRTVTEKSDETDKNGYGYDRNFCLDDPTASGTYNYKDKKNKENRYKAIRGDDNLYNGTDRMKARYSRDMDKESGAHSDQDDTVNFENKYESNYEGDEFEEQDEADEDDDDDFTLPRNHEQNNATDEHRTQNIKKWIQENQKKEANQKVQLQPDARRVYQSTGSQATNAAQRAEEQKNQQKKTPKKKKKGHSQYEEKKSEHVSQQQKNKSQAQITQNKENQKEILIRKIFRELLSKLKSAGDKAMGSQSKATTNEIAEINSCYLFIRSVSTYAGFQNPKKTQKMKIDEVTEDKLLSLVHSKLWQESQSKLYDDLMSEPQKQKSGKNTQGGAATAEPKMQAAAAQAASGNPDAMGMSISQAKKNKKKNKKEKERLAKEQAEKEQVEKERAEKEKATEKERKQVEIDQVIEDIVITRTVDNTQEANKQDDQENQAQSGEQKKSKARKNKRNKKKKNPTQDDKEDNKTEEFDNQEHKKEDEQQDQEILPAKAEEKKEQSDQTIDVQQDLDNVSHQQEAEYKRFVHMLQMLETEDAKLRNCEKEILAQKKKQLFPNGINLGVFSDYNSSQSSKGNSKRASRENSAEKQRQYAKSIFNQLSELMGEELGVPDKLGTLSNMKYIDERRSLLSGEFHHKYPDEKEIDVTEVDENQEAKEAELERIGRDLDEDDEVKIFNAVEPLGVRRRTRHEIESERNELEVETSKSPPRTEMEERRLENAELMREQQDIFNGLNELNCDIKSHGATFQESNEARQMKFTDLKEQRENEAKMKKFQREYNLIKNDYSERPKEIESEKDGDKDNGTQNEAIDPENPDGKKGKKKRKKAKKKKKNAEGDINLPETIAEAAQKSKDIKADTEQWQSDLVKTLKKEKYSDDESPTSRASGIFDDDFFVSDPKYVAAVENIEKKQPAGSIQKDEDREYESSYLEGLPTSDQDDNSQILKHDDIDLILPAEENKLDFKVDIKECKKFAQQQRSEGKAKIEPSIEIEEVIDTDQAEESKMSSGPQFTASQSQANSIKIDPSTNTYQVSKQQTSNFSITFNSGAASSTALSSSQTTILTQQIAKELIQNCIQSYDSTTLASTNQMQINSISSCGALTTSGITTDDSEFTSIDPVIRLDGANAEELDDDEEEQLESYKQNIEEQKLGESGQETGGDPDGAEAQPSAGKKSQDKQDKKKMAKKNAKMKAQQHKQSVAEAKVLKQQQRKDMWEQKLLTKVNEESKQLEDEQLTLEIMQQTQKNVKLPDLQALCEDQYNQGRGSPPQQPSSLGRQSKKVKFERDASYDSQQVPRRSSRGTSLGSSSKNDQINDATLNEIQELFPNDYKNPPESTTQSLKDSLNNSKKNSPESTSNKNLNDGSKTDARLLQQKLADLQKAQSVEMMKALQMKKRSSSTQSQKKGNKRRSSIDSNRKQPQVNSLVGDKQSVEKPAKSNKSKNKNQDKRQQLPQKTLTNQKQNAQKNDDKKDQNQNAKINESSHSQTALQQVNNIPQIQIMKPEPKLTKQQKKKLQKEKMEKEKQMQGQQVASNQQIGKSEMNSQSVSNAQDGSKSQTQKQEKQKEQIISNQSKKKTGAQDQKPDQAQKQYQAADAPAVSKKDKRKAAHQNESKNDDTNKQKSKSSSIGDDKALRAQNKIHVEEEKENNSVEPQINETNKKTSIIGTLENQSDDDQVDRSDSGNFKRKHDDQQQPLTETQDAIESQQQVAGSSTAAGLKLTQSQFKKNTTAPYYMAANTPQAVQPSAPQQQSMISSRRLQQILSDQPEVTVTPSQPEQAFPSGAQSQASPIQNTQEINPNDFTGNQLTNMAFGADQFDGNQTSQAAPNPDPSSTQQPAPSQQEQMMMTMINHTASGPANNLSTQNQESNNAQQQQQSQTQISIDIIRFTVQQNQVPVAPGANPQQHPQQHPPPPANNFQNPQPNQMPSPNQMQCFNNWQQQYQQQQQNLMNQNQSNTSNRANQNQQQALQQQQMQGFMQSMAAMPNNMKNMQQTYLSFQNMQNMLSQSNLRNFNAAPNLPNFNQGNMPAQAGKMANMGNVPNLQPMSNMANFGNLPGAVGGLGGVGAAGNGMVNFGQFNGNMPQNMQNLANMPNINNMNQMGNQFNQMIAPQGSGSAPQLRAPSNTQQLLMQNLPNNNGQQIRPNSNGSQNNMMPIQQQARQIDSPSGYSNQSVPQGPMNQYMQNFGMANQFNQNQSQNQQQTQQSPNKASSSQQQNAQLTPPKGAPVPAQLYPQGYNMAFGNLQQNQFVNNQMGQVQQQRTSPQQQYMLPNQYMYSQMNNALYNKQGQQQMKQIMQGQPMGQQQDIQNTSPQQINAAANSNGNAQYQQYVQQLMQAQQQNQQYFKQQQQNFQNNLNRAPQINKPQAQNTNSSSEQQALSTRLREEGEDHQVRQRHLQQIPARTGHNNQSNQGNQTRQNQSQQKTQKPNKASAPTETESRVIEMADQIKNTPLFATDMNQLFSAQQNANIQSSLGPAASPDTQATQILQQPNMNPVQIQQHAKGNQSQLTQDNSANVGRQNRQQQKKSDSQTHAAQSHWNKSQQDQQLQNNTVDAQRNEDRQRQTPPSNMAGNYPQNYSTQNNQQQFQNQNQFAPQHNFQQPQFYPNQVSGQLNKSQQYQNLQNQGTEGVQGALVGTPRGNQQNMLPQSMPQMPQMYPTPQSMQHQQMVIFKLSQLQSQGYVMQAHDHELLSRLSLHELEYVHEFYEVLDAQILKLKCDQESKLQKTQKLRQIAFELIKDKIQEVYKKKNQDREGPVGKPNDVKVEIYGSMATGLAIDSSDLDILVHDFINQDSPRFHQLSRSELIEEMQDLHIAMDVVFALKTNTLIESATVPVIKLQIDLVKLCEREREKDPEFEVDPRNLELDEEIKILNIDITLDEPRNKQEKNGPDGSVNEHLGLQCCKYIKQRLDNYPKMKIIALIFKKFLSLKNMNKPFSGGLSSYSLVQMILAVMKIEEQFDMHNKLSVAMIFKHFLQEYGFNFAPLEKGIGQDGLFYDITEFSYVFHTPNCNINVRASEPEKDETQEKEKNTILLDKNICTCGFINNSKHKSQGEGASGDQGNSKDPQNQLVTLLQRLLNNNNQHNNMQQMIDGNNGMTEQTDFKTRTMQQSHFMQPQLMIIDPLNKFNNIGKSSYNFQAIQAELGEVYCRLSTELVQFVRYASSRKNSQLNSANSQIDSPPPDIDGLIPRIFDVDYKISSNEHNEYDNPHRDDTPFVQYDSSLKQAQNPLQQDIQSQQPSSASSSGKKAHKGSTMKEELKQSSLPFQPTDSQTTTAPQHNIKKQPGNNNQQSFKPQSQKQKKKDNTGAKQANRARAGPANK